MSDITTILGIHRFKSYTYSDYRESAVILESELPRQLDEFTLLKSYLEG